MNLYPITFYPIFKERIWGGQQLKTILNKPISTEQVGESWEISTVAESVSVISNGFFQNQNLNEVIAQYPNEILGTQVVAQFGVRFPLLFKFLDAQKKLSIQVHPNDDLAQKRHHCYGKTEMWYVVQAEENAQIVAGFKETITPESFLEQLNNHHLEALLNTHQVKQGDIYFLEAGTVHAIGAGILIAEIQQTSDITYRIYDFDRLEADGTKRELHTALALEAINYNKIDTQKYYSKTANTPNLAVHCPYFTTNVIELNGRLQMPQKPTTFRVYMCVSGHFWIHSTHQKDHYKMGDTILIPALFEDFIIEGQATILEIYV
ncbi:type I phosphomannose isomerase catalytic subunit [Flavobacterium branchiophilum]|uniref:Phosphohexomutase n=1 Tax=Flavobacterium branchiophilum TaxID=55197 RepID=A0A2H3K8C0_9FLAO|nr:type I phosphomannose isomerase catalytic subunit [Flavobacterium branchiophilum]PDS21848.1 mannose-6-phosphate isomerase [Flavobacterium branchiophilum]